MRHATAVVLTMLMGGIWFLQGTPAGPELGRVSITPKFETAGIIVESRAAALGLEIERDGRFVPAHPFVRFDAGHMATSLFDLEPGTRYRVRIGGTRVYEFSTLPEYRIPAPRRVVRVADMQALQRAVAAARPGTEIRVAPGVYRGGLVIRRSGRPGAPIVIRGDVPPGRLPIDQRRDLPVIDATGEDSGIEIRDASHVVLDSLQVRNGEKHGVYLLRAAHCVVQNMQIYDNGYWNLIISKGGEEAGRHLIQYNHVADLEHGEFVYSYRRQPGVTYYGIQQDNQGGWGTTIRGNIVEGHVDGIMSSGDESMFRNVREDDPDVLSRWVNREVDVYDNIVRDQRDDAIEADGICVNQRVFRNLFQRAQNATSVSPAGPGPFFFVRNIMVDYQEGGAKLNTSDGRGVIRNIYYYHNVFLPSPANRFGGALTLWMGTPSKNLFFRNNIFSGPVKAISFQGLPHAPDMDYDLWDARDIAKARSRFASKGIPWEPHGIFAAARLDDRYRPRPDSPAVDAGTVIPGINDGYRGRGPDLGAFEVR